MSFKIPEKIEILGRVYTIESTTDGLHPHLDGKRIGRLTPDLDHITIYTGGAVSDTQVLDTLLHEIKHIINKQLCIVNPDDKLEEIDCDRFALFYVLIQKALDNCQETHETTNYNTLFKT